jgi:hypothetical protein
MNSRGLSISLICSEDVADTTSILSSWDQLYSNLLNVNKNYSLEESEICTGELDISEPSLLEVELAIKTLTNT